MTETTSTLTKMANSKTDVSRSFIESGMTLITQTSSDALLQESKKKRKAVKDAISDTGLWDPTTGPIE